MFLIKVTIFFQKLREKNLILILSVVGGVAIVSFLLIISVFIKEVALVPSESDISTSPAVTQPTSAPAGLEKDYSRLSKVVPGKSTLDDVLRINGKPRSVSTVEDKTRLYYKTPLDGFTNEVFVQNNVVVYSIENVFGSYRGSVGSFNSSYGEPDLSLFDKENNYSWYVYLKQGVAIENDGKDIGTILYFIPQDEEKFMSTLAVDLGLTSTPNIEE